MQVYLVTWKGQVSEPDAFRNFNDIEPSIRISWGQAQNLAIKCEPRAVGGPVFNVTGQMNGETFEEQLIVKRVAVYDSPTHL